jgi:hypothetical protein
MKTKQVTWIVTKNGEEIGRYASKRLAAVIASEIGGYVMRYEAQ